MQIKHILAATALFPQALSSSQLEHRSEDIVSTQGLSDSASLVKSLLQTAVPATVSHIADKSINHINKVFFKQLTKITIGTPVPTQLSTFQRFIIKRDSLVGDWEATVGYVEEKSLVFILRKTSGIDVNEVIYFLPEDQITAPFFGDLEILGEEEDEDLSIFQEAKENLKQLGYRAITRKLQSLLLSNHKLNEEDASHEDAKYILKIQPIDEKIINFLDSVDAQLIPTGAEPSTLSSLSSSVNLFVELLENYFCFTQVCGERAKDQKVGIQSETVDVSLDDITVEQGHLLLEDIAAVLASF